jgi:uncharacterized membrane protein YjgN (DUF898 family)
MDLHRNVSPPGSAEISSEPAFGDPGAPRARAQTSFVFTGRGAEYFRIWVVNTLFTLLTLGVYSAWAKVRRTRYLWQNTRLDGFAFDYHARPAAILRGRILAFGLFAAYSYAFDLSRAVGVAVLIGICAAGPWLFMRAQQFKLTNSSWRGLRFGFDARTTEAFRVVLPILLLWFSTSLGAVLFADEVELILWSQLPVIVSIPWMHHRLKSYQHRRAFYGDRGFSFRPVALRFYGVYAKGVGVALLGTCVAAILVGGGMGASIALLGDAAGDRAFLVGAIGGLIGVLAILVFAWPYLAARLQQVTWSSTTLGGVRFQTRIRARTLFWLTLRNVGLSLLTLGLYWPVAAMRLAKYRIESMSVVADEPFASIAAGTHSRSVGAGGEGAVDAFGIDLGL